ncbi:MAG: Rieske 2Fe-2S domain-containing protein [Acidobacteriia bacterium]|nr:Rieske 2Fe-2S domain-containing protein [Terriglobia bacterium]
MAFVRAAKKDDIPPGKIYEFQVGGKAIAIANVSGKLHAINSICAHQGGPLGEGELEGQIVTCPWHAWQYDVTTGKVVQSPTLGVECYPVEIRGDDIFVDAG